MLSLLQPAVNGGPKTLREKPRERGYRGVDREEKDPYGNGSRKA